MPHARPRAYMICTTPRSGSTLLCRMLAATGVAGSPDSHFHAPSLDGWLEAYGLDDRGFASRREALRAVFDAAVARGRGGGGPFGLRMQGASFPHFVERLRRLHPEGTGDAARIEAAFGPTLHVHLTRADRLGQAISRLRAEQTGLWHRAADGRELERLAPPAPPRFDRAAIAWRMAEARALDGAWRAWFAAQGIRPLRIPYDALARDPGGVVARLLAALGLDPAAARGIDPPTARLADDVSAAWRRRFEQGG